MARLIFPSSFKCDCGHQSDFSERTVRELGEISLRQRKAQVLSDSDTNEHEIVFRNGRPESVICPQLGECTITDEDTSPIHAGRAPRHRPTSAPLKFTPTQGRYLAFIDHYTKSTASHLRKPICWRTSKRRRHRCIRCWLLLNATTSSNERPAKLGRFAF